MQPIPSPSRPKPGQRFVAQAAAIALVLGLLPLVLPGPTTTYPRIFNAHAELIYNGLLRWISPKRSVRMVTIDPLEYADRRDTRMVGYGPYRKPREFRQFYRVHSMGWWPTAVVTGLVLATPLPWRRRLGGWLVALLLVDVLLLVRVGVMVWVNFEASVPGNGESWERTRQVAQESFTSWVPPLVIALFAWAAVARPATYVDWGAALRWLSPSGGKQRVRQPPPGRIAQEGQQQADEGSQGDEQRRDRDGPGSAET
jgi:hypothetical protein